MSRVYEHYTPGSHSFRDTIGGYRVNDIRNKIHAEQKAEYDRITKITLMDRTPQDSVAVDKDVQKARMNITIYENRLQEVRNRSNAVQHTFAGHLSSLVKKIETMRSVDNNVITNSFSAKTIDISTTETVGTVDTYMRVETSADAEIDGINHQLSISQLARPKKLIYSYGALSGGNVIKGFSSTANPATTTDLLPITVQDYWITNDTTNLATAPDSYKFSVTSSDTITTVAQKINNIRQNTNVTAQATSNGDVSAGYNLTLTSKVFGCDDNNSAENDFLIYYYNGASYVDTTYAFFNGLYKKTISYASSLQVNGSVADGYSATDTPAATLPITAQTYYIIPNSGSLVLGTRANYSFTVAGGHTLATIMANINLVQPTTLVTASLGTPPSPNQTKTYLILTSDTAGTDNSATPTATHNFKVYYDSGGEVYVDVTSTLFGGGGANTIVSSPHQTSVTTAQNSISVIDSVRRVNTTNTLEDIIPGLDITLLAINTGANYQTITVKGDINTALLDIKGLIDGYLEARKFYASNNIVSLSSNEGFEESYLYRDGFLEEVYSVMDQILKSSVDYIDITTGGADGDPQCLQDIGLDFVDPPPVMKGGHVINVKQILSLQDQNKFIEKFNDDKVARIFTSALVTSDNVSTPVGLTLASTNRKYDISSVQGIYVSISATSGALDLTGWTGHNGAQVRIMYTKPNDTTTVTEYYTFGTAIAGSYPIKINNQNSALNGIDLIYTPGTGFDYADLSFHGGIIDRLYNFLKAQTSINTRTGINAELKAYQQDEKDLNNEIIKLKRIESTVLQQVQTKVKKAEQSKQVRQQEKTYLEMMREERKSNTNKW